MSTEEEQARYLEDAQKEVQKQAFYMKRAMHGDSLKLALDHATEMLRELRTNLLTPKNYYELYMKVLDEMRELEEYLTSLQEGGRSIVEIYEQVQCCANVVPRLYLLCCVGGVYIASKEAPAKDVLKDLIEVIKGVQHPMRGLFLRNYLTLISKNKLPDVGSPYEGIGGTIQDAYSFLIQNFIETNRLWVRLQTQGASKERKKRERERMDLRILVGTNLVRLSQLEGLDVSDYKSNVLPKILEEVLSCKDTIAQSYLMDCIIQVFPDDFHLNTLELLLQTVSTLKEKVNVRAILESLMDRLAAHSANNAAAGAVGAEMNSFKLFNDCITTLIEDRANMSLTETLRLQTVLTNFALKCHPSRIDYVSHCLSTSGMLIEKTDFVATSAKETQQEGRSTNETTTQIEALLSSPLSTLALRVLEIPSYVKLMSYLPWGNWKEVAATLLRAVISNNTPLPEVEQVEQLFKTITPLLRDRDAPQSEEEGPTPVSLEVRRDQALVSRVPHLVECEDTDTQLQILVVVRSHFTSGGSQRMQFTFPSLVFAALKLARRVMAREKAVETEEALPPQFSTRKVFHFVIEAVTALATAHPEPALNLFLQSAQATDECGFHAIAYEFVKEALLLYENDITDSRSQTRSLTSVIGTLLHCRHFPTEDYEALITKVAQYCNKLLKKPDQCRMIGMCSLLFWPPKLPDGSEKYSDCDRVLECMQRSLKIASVCNTSLFVEILDRYLYYFENGNPTIQVRYISGLIALINEQNAAAEGGESALTPAVEAHFKNTLDYIKGRQQAPDTAAKFLEISME
ncbi:vacuolar protein sorting-associated protein 35-like protein [Ochromonadaceae sp. CCMP2298]|nr:vacuolar protein sorting-associated protein 35-like protein [Ochromonadaceae sp. CCMP2298]